jgi:hypothetical protein
VLADCDIAEPPVDEQRILDYFSAEVDRTPICTVAGCEVLATSKRRPSGILQRGRDDDSLSLWVDPAVTPGRFRWTVFHELGHDDLGHQGFMFADDDGTLGPGLGRSEVVPTEYREVAHQTVLPGLSDSADGGSSPVMMETPDSIRAKQQERQANLYASEMIMPSQWFVPEARNLPMGIDAVEQMSTRYQASLEATAIRYAQACPDKCAVLAAEPIRDTEGNHIAFTVLYCIRRRRSFLQGIHRDARLPFSGLFASAWEARGHVRGIVTGDLLGMSQRVELSADALKLGNYGRVVALLWLESGQLSMLVEEGTA